MHSPVQVHPILSRFPNACELVLVLLCLNCVKQNLTPTNIYFISHPYWIHHTRASGRADEPIPSMISPKKILSVISHYLGNIRQ